MVHICMCFCLIKCLHLMYLTSFFELLVFLSYKIVITQMAYVCQVKNTALIQIYLLTQDLVCVVCTGTST